MSQYDDLLSDFDELRKRTARFRRVAFHVHSPLSHDWGKKGEAEVNDPASFTDTAGQERFAEELKNRFDLVAITDHMKCAYGCSLSTATIADDEFLVLPGMEVNLRGEAALGPIRLHLLAIFPEGSSVERFAQIFTGTPVDPDDTQRMGHEEITGVPLKDWVDVVKGAGGLCIAAHIDRGSGVRYVFRQTSGKVMEICAVDESGNETQQQEIADYLKEYLFSIGFHAVEISKPSDRPHYHWYSAQEGEKVCIPVVLHGDAHCIEDFDRLDRITWVKMTTLNFEGLRNALSFADTRVHFESDPITPSPRLLGIEIVGSENSLFSHEKIAFAENLNCIIGPRGSGKSTLVEVLRYVFGYNKTLYKLDENLSKSIRSLQQANLVGCIIRIAYLREDGDIHFLEATFDPSEDYVTKVFNQNGTQVNIPDVEASGDYPLRLFGWSEIETLGRDSSHQRDLLDLLVPELSLVLQEREETRLELISNRKNIELIVDKLNTLYSQDNCVIKRYTEYKETFERLNTPEVKDYFSALDLATGKRRVLEQINQNAQELLQNIDGVDPSSLRGNIERLLEDSEQPLSDWWFHEEIEQLRLVEVETEIQRNLGVLVRTLSDFSQLVAQQITTAKQRIEQINSEIRSAISDDADLQKISDLRANAERRLGQAKQVRDEYLTTWGRLQDALDVHNSIGEKLIECQDRIAGIRFRNSQDIETTLNKYFGEEMRITLEFKPGQDREYFMESLSKIGSSITRNYRVRCIPELLTERLNPVVLSRVYLNGDAEGLTSLRLARDDSIHISEDEAKGSIDAWRPSISDDSSQVDTLLESGQRLIELLKLQEVPWDDAVSICLNDRPVTELSPGQRSSAMLPLIALAENAPLVIDQPEDNLDNRLVGRVLTEIIAALKQHRQIIVCTHNPNIVVSGDAEQVIVLDAISDRRAQVIAHGSIDNADIVENVIDILEGGLEAFNVRKKRYGF